jgi:hypothetical protein
MREGGCDNNNNNIIIVVVVCRNHFPINMIIGKKEGNRQPQLNSITLSHENLSIWFLLVCVFNASVNLKWGIIEASVQFPRFAVLAIVIV